MPKVTGPLFSFSASGTVGGVITFVCGLYARMAAQKREFTPSDGQVVVQTKWSDGCKVWQSGGNNKDLWSKFVKLVKESGECDIRYAFYMTGFQTFMSFYMTYGVDGWSNYPLPPS